MLEFTHYKVWELIKLSGALGAVLLGASDLRSSNEEVTFSYIRETAFLVYQSSDVSLFSFTTCCASYQNRKWYQDHHSVAVYKNKSIYWYK